MNKIKRGTINNYGMIFWSYRYNKEIWLTKEKFERKKLLKNLWQRKNVNPIENRKNVKNWLKNNLHKKMCSVRKYQAMKKNSKINCNNLNVVSEFYKAAKRVGNCLGIKFNVDHVVPISKGGSHSPENLQWVPSKWNFSKGNKIIDNRWSSL
jgi:hypothetical protein